jgi:hypothetical protein
LLHSIIEEVDIDVCPFVRYLLPIVMSLMTDPIPDCAKEASKAFADLVQVAPLVREVASVPWSVDVDDHAPVSHGPSHSWNAIATMCFPFAHSGRDGEIRGVASWVPG